MRERAWRHVRGCRTTLLRSALNRPDDVLHGTFSPAGLWGTAMRKTLIQLLIAAVVAAVLIAFFGDCHPYQARP